MTKDCQIRIDQNSDVPIWVQIRIRLLHCIVSGTFRPGEQLPTVRELASKINVNYNTVSKVYQDLERDGFIVSKRGRGSFVADLDDFVRITTVSPIDAAAEEYIRVCEEHAVSPDEMVAVLQHRLDLRPNELPANASSSPQSKGVANG